MSNKDPKHPYREYRVETKPSAWKSLTKEGIVQGNVRKQLVTRDDEKKLEESLGEVWEE